MLNLLLLTGLAFAAPATVLQHDVSYVLDRNGELTTTIDWIVRIDDPVGCSAGLTAPAALHGASDNEGRVYNDLLLLPSELEEGDVFSLHREHQDTSWSKSGYFRSHDSLPVESARVTVEIPEGMPLHNWNDDLATVVDISPTRLEVLWKDIPGGQTGEFAWSAQPDWIEAGNALTTATEDRFGNREDLGQALAGSLSAVNISALADRVLRNVRHAPSRPQGWGQSRTVQEVVKSGSGSAHERALLMVNLLTLAGYDARLGQFRPGSVSSSFPLTLPAADAFPEPLVVVQRGGELVYLDPAANQTSVPALPTKLLGGVAWSAGTLPRPFPTQGDVSGVVRVAGNVNVTAQGDLSYRIDVTTEGSASESIRDLLAPLDAEQRRASMIRLFRLARPDLESITVEMSAVERSSKKLQISISATQRNAMMPLANGLKGEVRPVLAPALAGWLPTNVRVEETLTLSSPGDLDVLAIGSEASAFHPTAQVSREVAHDNRLSSFKTQVRHTRRVLSPEQSASVNTFLKQESATGHTVFLFPKDVKSTTKAVEADSSIEPLDRFTINMLLMVSNQDFEGAAKHFKSTQRRLALDILFASADRFERTGLDELWPHVLSLPKRDNEALALANLLDRRGLSDLAWQTAMEINERSSAAIRLEALLMIERLPHTLPEEKNARNPSMALSSLELLDQARSIDPNDIRIALREAHHAIERGDGEAALSILNAHEGVPRHGLGMARKARAMALANHPRQQIALTIERARSLAPSDASVAHESSKATRLVGDLHGTAQHLLDAAWILGDDANLWAQAGDASLLVGNLMDSLVSYRMASDLETDSVEAAQHLLRTAIWASDEGSARIAKERLKDFSESMEVWPIPLADLLPNVPPEHRMALLRMRDKETIQSAVLLEERARMSLQSGRYEETIRDASILEYDLGLQVGRTLAFLATLGLHRNDQRLSLLDVVSQSDEEAALARLEWGLLTGDADVGTLLMRQSHPHAMALREVLESTEEAGEAIEGLPTPPVSFVENAWISTSPGVHAWSHPQLASSVVVWKGEAQLPGAIDALFDLPAQDLDLLPDGTRIVALEGSMLPIHAAIQQRGDLTVISLARTPALTVQALRSFPPTP